MKNQTGLIYFPHYIDPGSLCDTSYNIMDIDDIFLGDIKSVLSVRELIELSNDDKFSDRPDQMNVLDAVESAESDFDSYVNKKYTIPLENVSGHVPRVAKQKCLYLFKYFLYARRPNVPTDVVILYDKTTSWLRLVSEGRIEIPNLRITVKGDVKHIRRTNSIVEEFPQKTSTFGVRLPNLDGRFNSSESGNSGF